MARRFRKKGKIRRPRGVLLWILPLPLIPAFFISLARGHLLPAVGSFAAFGFFLGGAFLISQDRNGGGNGGEQSRSRLSGYPVQYLAMLLVGTGAFLCCLLAVGRSLVFSFMVGLFGFFGALLAYARPPRDRRSGGVAGAGYSAEEIAAAMDRAGEKIRNIERAARSMENHELREQLFRISGLARRITDSLEEDPRDLRTVRRFIHVYLDGVEKVTDSYAGAARKGAAGELLPRFRELLTTLEEVFQQQHEKLMANDLLDLDVRMEVLMKRLRHEGIL